MTSVGFLPHSSLVDKENFSKGSPATVRESITSLLVAHLRTALPVVRTPRAGTVTAETDANVRTDLRIALEMRPDDSGHRRRTALLLTGVEAIVFVQFLLEEDDGRVAARRETKSEEQQNDDENHGFGR